MLVRHHHHSTSTPLRRYASRVTATGQLEVLINTLVTMLSIIITYDDYDDGITTVFAQ